MEGQKEVKKEASEIKYIMKTVEYSLQTLKLYGMKNICGLKASKYDEALQHFNTSFRDTFIREVLRL